MVKRPKIVVVGDLNGADDVLGELLVGTRLMSRAGEWIGGTAELVQLGDLFNRGGGARKALELLLRLQRQARRCGGDVTILLGNHEAMTALRNEAYCTTEEYLSFATAAQQAAWPTRLSKAASQLMAEHPARGPILPLEPRLEAWKVAHVPGKGAMRRALSPRGKLGRALRRLPVVYQRGELLFAHSAVLPAWAALGVRGLNRRVRQEWRTAPTFWRKIAADSLFRAPHGPLWDRSVAHGGKRAEADLQTSLQMLGARRMIVGHTTASSLNGGRPGRIHTRYGERLVLADVGLTSGPHTPRAALVIQGRRGFEWTPQGRRLLWQD